MTLTLTAEYLAEENTLRLSEPLEGVENHERVTVVIHSDPSKLPVSGSELRETVSVEAGDSLASAIDEVFGPIAQ